MKKKQRLAPKSTHFSKGNRHVHREASDRISTLWPASEYHDGVQGLGSVTFKISTTLIHFSPGHDLLAM